MDAERQKKIATYQEKARLRSEANKETVDKEMEVLVKEIQDMEKRITESQQKAQQELQAKQGEIFQPIYKKAEDAIKAVSKEKGYAYVFDVSQQGVVYFDGGDDILKFVQAKLGISATAAPAATPKK
jgi:outer membrane protein